MKVLITGANGYLGKGVVKALLDRGIEVIATDFECTGIDERANTICSNLFTVEDPFSFFASLMLYYIWHGETGLYMDH